MHLNQLSLIVLDNPTALQLFHNDALDWTGSPLSTLSMDALSALKKEGILEVMPGAGTFLVRINTEKPPFTSPKMRQAFAFALNRSDLVEHVLQGNQIPAFGMIPPSVLEQHVSLTTMTFPRRASFLPRHCKNNSLHLRHYLRSPFLMQLVKGPIKLPKSCSSNGKRLLELCRFTKHRG